MTGIAGIYHLDGRPVDEEIDRTGNYVIAADARIDNRRVLVDTLTPPIPDGRPVMDPELILEAYKRWG